MIHIVGKYYAKVDDHQITVGVPYESKSKDGSVKTVLSDTRYYSDLESALKGTYKRLSIDTLQRVDGDLNDAIKALYTLRNDFKEVIDRVMGMISDFEDDGK